jgi:WD40 repeat protein
MLAAAGADDKVWVLNTSDGRRLHELSGPGADLRALAFSPDGARLAAAGRSGAVRIWDAASGEQVADVQASSRRICALAFSPDGKLLAVGGKQRVVRLLDAASGQPVADLPERPGEVLSLCFCGNTILASAGSTNEIRLWNVATHQERNRLVGHTGSVTMLVYSAQAGTLISGSYDTTVRLWAVSGQDKEKARSAER